MGFFLKKTETAAFAICFWGKAAVYYVISGEQLVFRKLFPAVGGNFKKSACPVKGETLALKRILRKLS